MNNPQLSSNFWSYLAILGPTWVQRISKMYLWNILIQIDNFFFIVIIKSTSTSFLTRIHKPTHRILTQCWESHLKIHLIELNLLIAQLWSWLNPFIWIGRGHLLVDRGQWPTCGQISFIQLFWVLLMNSCRIFFLCSLQFLLLSSTSF